jgi:Fe-S-cluster containining protein
MLLSNKDIQQIKELGFPIDFFTISIDGWIRLKNKKGRCVFHDGAHCVIYEKKPEGCQLYPIVYDIDTKQAFLDDECPQKTQFNITKHHLKKLDHLISRIMSERTQRIQKNL